MKKHSALSTTLAALGCATLGNAQATVIHQDINQAVTTAAPLGFDINGDGVIDLSFRHTYSTNYSYAFGDLWVFGQNGAQVSLGGPLAFGDLIDGSLGFASGNHMADYNAQTYYYSCGSRGQSTCTGTSRSFQGSWNDGASMVMGYLGFSLSLGDDELFGWAHVSMYYQGYALIHDLAYETTPFTGITAGQLPSANHQPPISQPSDTNPGTVPEPSTLALLALGAVGVAAMRRRRAAA